VCSHQIGSHAYTVITAFSKLQMAIYSTLTCLVLLCMLREKLGPFVDHSNFSVCASNRSERALFLVLLKC